MRWHRKNDTYASPEEVDDFQIANDSDSPRRRLQTKQRSPQFVLAMMTWSLQLLTSRHWPGPTWIECIDNLLGLPADDNTLLASLRSDHGDHNGDVSASVWGLDSSILAESGSRFSEAKHIYLDFTDMWEVMISHYPDIMNITAWPRERLDQFLLSGCYDHAYSCHHESQGQ